MHFLSYFRKWFRRYGRSLKESYASADHVAAVERQVFMEKYFGNVAAIGEIYPSLLKFNGENVYDMQLDQAAGELRLYFVNRVNGCRHSNGASFYMPFYVNGYIRCVDAQVTEKTLISRKEFEVDMQENGRLLLRVAGDDKCYQIDCASCHFEVLEGGSGTQFVPEVPVKTAAGTCVLRYV